MRLFEEQESFLNNTEQSCQSIKFNFNGLIPGHLLKIYIITLYFNVRFS